MRKYPYQHLDINTLKGERWKDLPGLGGYYLVSSYGRIKRLRYEMQYRNGAIYTKEEKIIKPSIVKQRNHFKNDHSMFLINRVIFKKKRYNYTIARIVYYCFVEPFNYTDSEHVIICKDANNFNIRPSNLRKVNLQERKQRIADRDRYRSPFAELSDRVRKKQRAAIVKAVSKPVTQYDLSGKKIKTYPSMAAAQRATGVFASSIGTRAAGKGKTAGGFIWKWAKV